MGRGGQKNLLYGGGLRGANVSLPANTTRSLQKSFNANKAEWKKQEKEYISNVISELDAATQRFAESDSGWRQYLDIYAQMPNYTPRNNIWARSQLRAKGMDEPRGIVMSESRWKAMGRRIKPEFKRQKGNWDDSLAVEMTMPMTYKKEVQKRDAQGNVVIGADGKPVTTEEFRQYGYKAFIAYHEDATEDINGGEPKPLPSSNWEGIEGSKEGAEKLLNDIEHEICFANKINFTFGTGKVKNDYGINSDSRVAKYNADSNTIVVNPNAAVEDQAASALREVFVALNKQDKESNRSDQTAIASAQYVISSLYGLKTDQQTFPYLKELAGNKKDLNSVTTRTHKLVGKIIPVIDAKAKNAIRAQKEYQPRSKRYQAQKSAV